MKRFCIIWGILIAITAICEVTGAVGIAVITTLAITALMAIAIKEGLDL